MRLIAVLLAALVFLAGCAGIPQTDGLPASHPSTAWRPVGKPRAVVLAVHGFNDHRTAFTEFAARAADAGVLVEAYDQRGFGESPDWGRWAGTDVLAADLARHVRDLRREHPGPPLFVLGESMGAAVTVVALTSPGAPKVDGVILSAPAVWGGEAMNPFYRGTLWVMRRLMPNLKLSGRGLGRMASDNIPMLRALGDDPLFIKETRVQAIAGLVDLMGEARERGPALRMPTLILRGEHEEIVPPEAQLEFAASVGADRCTLVSYPEGWHMLLRDLQRERVWTDVLAWIARQPLPSGLGRDCRAAVAAVGPGAAG